MAHEMPAVRPAGGAQVGKFIILGVIAVGIGLFLYFDLGRFLSLESLKANRDHLLAFTEDNYTAAVGLFILLYIAVTGLSLPGATILTLAGGFVFGAVPATLYVNIGATTGATLAFLAARYVAERLGRTKIRKVVGAAAAGVRQECLQLPAHAPVDSAVSVLRGESGLRTDASERRHVCGGDRPWHYSGLVRLCLCRPAARHNQFA